MLHLKDERHKGSKTSDGLWDRDQITFKHMNKSIRNLCACAESRKGEEQTCLASILDLSRVCSITEWHSVCSFITSTDVTLPFSSPVEVTKQNACVQFTRRFLLHSTEVRLKQSDAQPHSASALLKLLWAWFCNKACRCWGQRVRQRVSL